MGLPVNLPNLSLSPVGGDRALARHTDEIRDRLSAALKIVDELTTVPAQRNSEDAVTEQEIREMLRQRRRRDKFFGSELFADPAWDILLQLYSAELGQHRAWITSLARGAGVPMTTALRWIASLENSGLIERRPDALDGRRHFMTLTYRGLEAMNGYFRTIPRGTPLI
jgi:DNA-binding MarR family transcriptional regulator